jgi:2',3'-cyclic-nucleotide 2'-phosphodiesterase (5'-nucleotidase family)
MPTVFKGEEDIQSLWTTGVNAIAAGNHEFDFRFKNLKQHKRQVAFFPYGEQKRLCHQETALANFASDIMVEYSGTQRELIVATA